jgi:hypothetical protein
MMKSLGSGHGDEFGASTGADLESGRRLILRVQAAIQSDRVPSRRDAEGGLVDGELTHPAMVRIADRDYRAAFVPQRPTVRERNR